LANDAVKLERVATLEAVRGQGLGSILVASVLEALQNDGFKKIVITASCKAQAFYERLGFLAVGDVFEEVNILCQKMVLTFP